MNRSIPILYFFKIMFQIYRVKSGLMTWFTAPITKRKYLGMLLVPVLLLGFIPSICTFVIPETMPGLITFVLIFSLGNIGMSCEI